MIIPVYLEYRLNGKLFDPIKTLLAKSIRAIDKNCNNITDNIKYNKGYVDIEKPVYYNIYYQLIDSDNTILNKNLTVFVNDGNNYGDF